LDGRFREIGPCRGFREEVNALAYAKAAAEQWYSRSLVAVIGPIGLIAVFVSVGLRPTDPERESEFPGDGCDEAFGLPDAA
jgi:hypothetical protein